MAFNKLILLFCFTCSLMGFSQIPELSPLAKISVLTCGPGDELYSSFGHSAFRVHDPTLGIDVIYNYGVFDTGAKNFYVEFSKGRMYYRLVRQDFQSYLRSYKIENRWVKEQGLNLSLKERKKLFQFLENNNLPENKVYRYDYFHNNCATKIWDVLKENFKDKLVFDETYLEEEFTFRELVHHNIKINSWGAFGIDLALGSVIDRKANAKEHLYLPIYVLRQLQVAQLNGTPIVSKETVLYKAVPKEDKSSFFTSPLFFMLLVAAFVLGITYYDLKRKKRSRWLDFGIFIITGLAGTLLFFLWFMTDHVWTVANYNILWACPINLILAFFVLQKSLRPWISYYLLALLALLLLTLLLWGIEVQAFSWVLFPVLLALTARYYYIWQVSQKDKKLRL